MPVDGLPREFDSPAPLLLRLPMIPRLRRALPFLLVVACTPAVSDSDVLRVQLAEDSIGPVTTSALLRELRERWPEARDTLYLEHEAIFPALHIPLNDVTVTAVQSRMDYDEYTALPLDPECPADFWVVTGGGAVFPGGGSMAARWRDLVALYGPAQASGEIHVVRASFQRLPGWHLDLSVEDDVLAAVQNRGAAAVPADAGIWRAILPVRADARRCLSD